MFQLSMNLRACFPAGLSAAIKTTDSSGGVLNKKIKEIVATEEKIKKLENEVHGIILPIKTTKRIRFLITIELEPERNSYTLKLAAEGKLDGSEERCMCPLYCLFSRINLQLGDTTVLFDREVLLNDEECSPKYKWSCNEAENLRLDGALPDCFCLTCGCSTSTNQRNLAPIQRSLKIERSLEDRDISIQMFPNYQVPSFKLSEALAELVAPENPGGVFSIGEIGKRFFKVIKDNKWHSTSQENKEVEMVHYEPGLRKITDADFEFSGTTDILKPHFQFPDATEVKLMIKDQNKPEGGEINLPWVNHRLLAGPEEGLLQKQVETLREIERNANEIKFLKTLATDPIAALEEVKEEEEDAGPPKNFKQNHKKASFYRQPWVKEAMG